MSDITVWASFMVMFCNLAVYNIKNKMTSHEL